MESGITVFIGAVTDEKIKTAVIEAWRARKSTSSPIA